MPLISKDILIMATLTIGIAYPLMAQGKKLYYPRPEASFDKRTGYPLQLLRLAFSHSDQLKDFELTPSEMAVPRGRSLKLLKNGIGVDVFWGISTEQRRKNLQEVDFDIYKGLFGYRLLLVQVDRLAEFAAANRSVLKNKVAGLSPDWPDYRILERNGFAVQGTSSYASLFKLLQLGRVDYLPRSVFEVWSELEHMLGSGITVSPNIAIHYTIKFNFYFSKENDDLASALEAALKDLTKDGSFDAVFELVWSDVLKKSSLKSKVIVQLEAL